MIFTKENSDYHIHSKYSPDSRLEPQRIIRKANRLGLDTIAVTDHDTIKGGLETKRVNETELEVVPGVEVRTDRGDLIGLGLRSEVKNKKLEGVCEEIKEKGGKVYVPHPFDRIRSSALREDIYHIEDFIDCVEGFNGRCILNRFNDKALSFAKERNLPILTGSDAHFLFEIGNNLERSAKGRVFSFFGFCLTKGLKMLKT